MGVFGKVIGYLVVCVGFIAVAFGVIVAVTGGGSDSDLVSGGSLAAGLGVAFAGVLLAGFGTGIVLLAEILEAVDGVAYLQRLRERPSMRQAA